MDLGLDAVHRVLHPVVHRGRLGLDLACLDQLGVRLLPIIRFLLPRHHLEVFLEVLVAHRLQLLLVLDLVPVARYNWRLVPLLLLPLALALFQGRMQLRHDVLGHKRFRLHLGHDLITLVDLVREVLVELRDIVGRWLSADDKGGAVVRLLLLPHLLRLRQDLTEPVLLRDSHLKQNDLVLDLPILKIACLAFAICGGPRPLVRGRAVLRALLLVA
mmetsp:Transcript_22404/g.60546  ORF Transcript_22404/g.60546 Transcript_22404/m.60546 type:complete len:216 (-) Transcript_22404:179-826(-)